MRGWLKWFSQGLWKRRKPIIAWTVLSLVVTGAAFARTYDWAGRPERTINDPAFERAAVKVCETEIPKLRAVKRDEDTEDPLEEETADDVDEVADKLGRTVDRLRALDVRAPDAPAVNEWFGDFDDFIAAGRNYADALRRGNEDVYNEVDNQAVEPLKRIRDFARANYIDACIP